MRRLVLSLILVVATLFLFAPTQQAKPAPWETIHRVILAEPCPFGWPGKPEYGTVMGEWILDCDGNWEGWGWTPNPNENCQDVERSVGQMCGQ